jgi:molybdate transport system substrate-binding protein
LRIFVVAVIIVTLMSSAVRADDLVVYGAGTLREAIGQIAMEFGHAHGLAVTTQFGPSGRMRERIEKGERVDLFASADVGHARKLVEDGRASVMAVFVRNTVCLLSPSKFGATTATVLEKLLAPGVRVGVSPPKVDPLGDYTERLFGLIDRLRPGSGAAMQARAVILDTLPGAPPRRNRATPTPTRSWMGVWMPASSTAPVEIGMPGCCRTRRWSNFHPSFRSVLNMGWPC